MRAPLIIVAGTGTAVGKTHVAAALLRAWSQYARVVGYKPIETGVPRGREGGDARSLRLASSFHVKPPARAFTFREPISPHLAARHEGRRIALRTLVGEARRLRAAADGVVVELAGGLFSPLSRHEHNLDLARALEPSAIVLVAPNRLGVLHDVAATVLAAQPHRGLLAGVILSAPRRPDASTRTNANEISWLGGARVLASVPRAPIRELASSAAMRRVLRACLTLRG